MDRRVRQVGDVPPEVMGRYMKRRRRGRKGKGMNEVKEYEEKIGLTTL